MAKDKKKKKKADGAKGAKAARTAKPAKLPKTVAGIKVPRELREPGGKLLEAVRNPLVIDLAAAALVAAAAGLRARGQGKQAASAAPDLGTILAATAIEGVRRLGGAASKSGGAPADEKKS